MGSKLFLSHRMDILVDCLVNQLDRISSPMEMRTIVVSSLQMKQWLLLEIAKRNGVAMGLKVVEIEQIFPSPPNPLELICRIYRSLTESTDLVLKEYLEGKEKRALDLSEQLASLFYSYGLFGKQLFHLPPKDWQQALLQSLFLEGSWRLPVQVEARCSEPIICFGIDYLPPVYWEYLRGSPSLSVYLFSPCADFWEDVQSHKERKRLDRYWKKKGASKRGREQLDAYLRDAPKRLANWGRLGRETLKILDSFDFEIEEAYPFFEPQSQLGKMQFDLLTFQETEQSAPDESIKIFLTGSSRLREIECLRDEILRLDVPYQDISVLAPDIEPYVPLIEFVFGEKIPYRIAGFDLATQSHYQQGMKRLFHLAGSRWDVEAVLTLFETSSFYKRFGWDEQQLATFKKWITYSQVKWGRDASHRDQILSGNIGKKGGEDHGTWERGLDQLLEAVIYLKKIHIHPDQFEEFLSVLFSLKQISLSQERSLFDWADFLEKNVQQFLVPDLEDEADLAVDRSFQALLKELRSSSETALFPFSVILRLLFRPSLGQIHAAHLHAVRFAPFQEGFILPAKALFLIGMDEESFPRQKGGSSLDLLKGGYPSQSDRDRYLFLKALFSAEQYLRISYGHITADEGKPVGPSLLVDELSSDPKWRTVFKTTSPSLKKGNVCWFCPIQKELPQGAITLSISDLRQLARHPWKFYLQKVQGMYLNESLEETFALQKGKLLHTSLDKPIDQGLSDARLPHGAIGQAITFEVKEKASQWQAQLSEWGVAPFSVILRENCTQIQQEGANWVAPSLEFTWDNLQVKLVGEIKNCTLKGLLCTGDDQIGSLLKVWPEALALASSLNTSQILMIKSGKVKQMENAHESLKRFIAYYFVCFHSLSPLLPDWADALLRKGASELEKAIQKGATFEDPVVDWILSRTEIPQAEVIHSNWDGLLKETFAELLQMFPVKNRSMGL